jgi:hypothetical protein
MAECAALISPYGLVMPARVAGIHVLAPFGNKDVDGRDKPGHDERGGAATMLSP